MITLPDQIELALRLLRKAGFEAFVVGGAVRDSLRSGGKVKDWDLTTNALPAETESVFSGFRLIETGLKHGTVTVLMDGEPVEITTYRTDGEYSDNRHPDSVSFTRSLAEDIARRDFTINSLAYSPETGVVDLAGGLEDLKNGIIRAVGDAGRRFNEDGLRILRALRFASVFGMTIERGTSDAVFVNKSLLQNLAAERINEELKKLLCGKGAAKILTEYKDVFTVIMPELSPMFGFDQRNPHHDRDVYAHTVAVVSSIPPVPELRFAALLHDIGKPSSFTLDEDGVGHFYGHADAGVAIADTVLRRLRFDNLGRERILTLIRHHDLPLSPRRKLVRTLLSKLGEDATRELLALHRADSKGQSPDYRYRLNVYDEFETLLNEILAEESCFKLKDLAIDGNDIAALGCSGKRVGELLNACLSVVLDEQTENTREALTKFAKDCLQRGEADNE